MRSMGRGRFAFQAFCSHRPFSQQLLVPDECMPTACDAITFNLPYIHVSATNPYYLEYKMIGRSKPRCFPNSVTLRCITSEAQQNEDGPADIIIHPHSYFSFDVDNQALSTHYHPHTRRSVSQLARLLFSCRHHAGSTWITTLETRIDYV